MDYTTDVSAGGAPLTATLTISATGNANRFTIDWGDGDTDTATTDSTPSHTYTDNTNSPFDVTVTAFNKLFYWDFYLKIICQILVIK